MVQICHGMFFNSLGLPWSTVFKATELCIYVACAWTKISYMQEDGSQGAHSHVVFISMKHIMQDSSRRWSFFSTYASTQILWIFTDIFVVLGNSTLCRIISNTCTFNYVTSTWVLQGSERSLSRKLADQGRCQKRINLILFSFIEYKLCLPKLLWKQANQIMLWHQQYLENQKKEVGLNYLQIGLWWRGLVWTSFLCIGLRNSVANNVLL